MLTAEKVATEETVGIQNPAPLRGQGNEWGMGGGEKGFWGGFGGVKIGE